MILLRFVRDLRSQSKLLLPTLERQTGRYRESLLARVETHEQKSPGEPIGVQKSEL